MTGFIAYGFLYPNRVSFHEAFEVLEPDDGKLSRPVLRGPGPRNGVRLLDTEGEKEWLSGFYATPNEALGFFEFLVGIQAVNEPL
jgi:hypothetical protein